MIGLKKQLILWIELWLHYRSWVQGVKSGGAWFFFFCAEFDPRFGAFQIFQAQGDTLCTYHWPRLGALLNFPDPYGPTALREWAEALHMDQIIIIRLSAILYKSWNSRGKVSNIIFKDILRYIKYIILVYTYHIYIYRMSTQKNWNLYHTLTMSSWKPSLSPAQSLRPAA